MTAPQADIRHQTSDIKPEGLPRRAPYLFAGAVLAAIFAWQSCLLLIRVPSQPRATIAENDYPLETGLMWIYKAPGGLQVVRRVGPEIPLPDGAVIKVGDDEYSGLESWNELQFDLPLLGRKTLLMRRTQDGVVARRGDRQQLIMKFPMRPGDSWTIDFPTEDLAECTVLEPEPIDVMNKRVRASKLRVVRTNRKSGKKTTDYEWYARGIGLVRMEVTFGLKATFELERFEKAK